MDFSKYIIDKANPIYIILIIGIAAFVALFCGLSKRKGCKGFIIAVSASCLVLAGIVNIYLFSIKGAYSTFLLNFTGTQVSGISLFLFISLNILVFLSVQNFRKENFLKILLIFLFCICSGLLVILSRNFLVIFLSFTIFVLGSFQLVSSINKRIEASYYLIKLFLNSFLALLLFFLGFSFMYAFTDFKNITQIIESVELNSPFVGISLIFIISSVYVYLFLYPFQGNYLKFLRRSERSSPAVIWLFYFPLGFVVFLKFKSLVYYFIEKNDTNILLAILILGSLSVLGPLVGAISTKSIRRIFAFLFLSFMSLSIFCFALLQAGLLGKERLEWILFLNIVNLALSLIPVWIVFLRFDDSIDSLNGFMVANPYMAVSISIALLSLAGMAGTPGFLIRYYFFEQYYRYFKQGNLGGMGIIKMAIFVLLAISFLFILANILRLIISICKKGSSEKQKLGFPKFYYIYITFFIILLLGTGILGLLEVLGVRILDGFSITGFNFML